MTQEVATLLREWVRKPNVISKKINVVGRRVFGVKDDEKTVQAVGTPVIRTTAVVYGHPMCVKPPDEADTDVH